MQATNPGEVRIRKFTIDGNDFSKLVIRLSIFESTIRPSTVCEVELHDATDIVNAFRLQGGELVKVVFETLAIPGLYEADFVLQSLNDSQSLGNLRTQVVRLTAISAHVMENSKHLVQKSYKDMSAVEVIRDLHYNFLRSSKNIELTSSRGMVGSSDGHAFIFSQVRPLDAIDTMRRRCSSSVYKSSSYAYFENMNSFFITPFEKLMDDAKGKPVAKFHQSVIIGTDIRVDNIRQNFAILVARETTSTGRTGRFDTINMVKALNHETQTWDYRTLSYTSDHGKPKKPSDYKISGNSPLNDEKFIAKYSDTTGSQSLIPGDSAKPEQHIKDFSADQMLYMEMLAGGGHQIQVPMNLNVLAGTGYYANTQSPIGLATQSRQDQKAGEMLAIKVRHTITVSGVEPRGMTTIEGVKGGLRT